MNLSLSSDNCAAVTEREPEPSSNILKDKVFWAEVVSVAGLGALLFFALKLTDIGQVTWIVGALLVYHRYVLVAGTRVSIAPLRRDIEQLERKTDSLAAHVDLNISSTESTRLREAVDTYFRIVEPELEWHKNEAVQDLRSNLQTMSQQKRSRTMYRAEYYDWLLPRIEATQPNSQIWAVSRMMNCEWDDSPEEESFLKANLDAASRGVQVTRIFLCELGVWNDAKEQLAPVQEQLRHSIKVYFGDVSSIRNRDAGILPAIGDGLIAFDKRVLLIDEHSEDGSARGYISVNQNEIDRMWQAFCNLRTLCQLDSLPPANTGS